MRCATAASLVVVTALSAGAAELRVAVFTLFRPARLIVQPAAPAVLNGRLLAAHARSTVDYAPARLAAPDGRAVAFSLSVPGKLTRDFCGTLDITSAAGVLTAVVTVELETAVAAALASEMPSDAAPDALAAMAVIVRSYYTAGPRHASFDFCDTTHCQFHRSPPADSHPAARAVARTRGVVVTWNGTPFAPYYSAACGGLTRTLEEAGLPVRDYPYRAAACPACERDEPEWERRLPLSDAAEVLDKRSEPARLRLVRALGWDALPGNRYSVRREGAAVIFSDVGRGHGIGVCQRGVIALGRQGAGWRAILERYLPGAAVRAFVR